MLTEAWNDGSHILYWLEAATPFAAIISFKKCGTASGFANEDHVRYFCNAEVLALSGTSAHTFKYYLMECQGDQRECVMSPGDVQLIYAWMGSNDIDFHHRRAWHCILDCEVENLKDQIRQDTKDLILPHRGTGASMQGGFKGRLTKEWRHKQLWMFL